MAADPYSRFVSVVRIALPLLALGILSTLFLVSSKVEPGDSIPFAEGDVAERIRDQRVTAPIFAGVTGSGDKVAVTAERMVTDISGTNTAYTVFAKLDYLSGGHMTLNSDFGEMNVANDTATLRGDVLLRTTSGYRLESDLLRGRFSEVELVSPGPVHGTGPGGTLDAGRMVVTDNGGARGMHFLFTGGVKLVYQPEKAE